MELIAILVMEVWSSREQSCYHTNSFHLYLKYTRCDHVYLHEHSISGSTLGHINSVSRHL